mmetsp:Transcript_111361/g.319957  ORF Transcript_111361/g.319957 Transcript_111361/m.319957 type:complete len:101 (-) Transcript_111361:545-847(-)
MCRGNDHFGLFPGKLFTEFQLKGKFILFGRRKMTFHSTNKGPGTQGDVIEIFLSHFWVDIPVVITIGHANQIASMVNIHSPILSGFVPTFVRGIGTKGQQ